MNLKTQQAFTKLQKALSSMKAIVHLPADPLRVNIDATIQRFEFTFELFWKALKCLLMELGQEVNFPKDVLRESYAGKLINNEALWIKMLEDRNNTSHTYDEQIADRIYEHIKTQYYDLMSTSFEELSQKYGF